jgi:hypothetical protein
MTRLVVGVALLLAQVGWLASGARPRAWAPFHEHAVYTLSVRTEEGDTLDTKASLERYQLPTWHVSVARNEAWETNDLERVKDVIVDFESTAAAPAREVVLRARVNSEEPPPWRWAR